MAAKTTAPAPYIPPEEDPKSPFEGLYHLLRRCIHGHSTLQEDVCHYQDVFGHSSESELEKAAESEYKEVFFRLYDEAYGTVQMISFYSKHSKYCRELRERVDDLEAECKDHETYAKVCEAKFTAEEKAHYDTKAELRKAAAKADENTLKIGMLESEVTRLKVKLFDMMEAQK